MLGWGAKGTTMTSRDSELHQGTHGSQVQENRVFVFWFPCPKWPVLFTIICSCASPNPEKRASPAGPHQAKPPKGSIRSRMPRVRLFSQADRTWTCGTPWGSASQWLWPPCAWHPSPRSCPSLVGCRGKGGVEFVGFMALVSSRLASKR